VSLRRDVLDSFCEAHAVPTMSVPQTRSSLDAGQCRDDRGVRPIKNGSDKHQFTPPRPRAGGSQVPELWSTDASGEDDTWLRRPS